MITYGQQADCLSGGITVSGSSKANVFIRNGSQARTIEDAVGWIKQRGKITTTMTKIARDPGHRILAQDVA